MLVTPEMLKSAGTDLRTLNGYQALFILEPFYRSINPYKSKLNMSISSLEYVSSLISVMIEEYDNKLQGYQTMLASRFMELVVYLSRQYDQQEKEIATRSGISVRHLNRIFRAYYQTSPIAYLQRLRLDRACTLLKRTDLSITKISYECGFNDSNYLTRQFKKRSACHPNPFVTSSNCCECCLQLLSS
ncbi:AraC-like DNA-binding protein [Fontibacillus solani]|uniref:AraC-like DNA-binding protein n=1 Tax=Fontibacillus solani TaxID=1572857 RepID=A0A7W3XRG9_9BACL|nr:AraC-like DNA-binding protein [Fontibacillus solani]